VVTTRYVLEHHIFNSSFCPQSVFICVCVWISEQTVIISLYSINWLVCIIETECVYCAVRTGFFKNKIGDNRSLEGFNGVVLRGFGTCLLNLWQTVTLEVMLLNPYTNDEALDTPAMRRSVFQTPAVRRNYKIADLPLRTSSEEGKYRLSY
jgi:hypothetical protein